MSTRSQLVQTLVIVAATLIIPNKVLAPSPPTPSFITVIGRVEGISGNLIHVNTGTQLLTLRNDSQTPVWKGKVFHDLPAVEIGDEISARCRKDASGQLV